MITSNAIIAISFIVVGTIGALCILIAKLIEEKKNNKQYIDALNHIVRVQKGLMSQTQLEQVEFILKSKHKL